MMIFTLPEFLNWIEEGMPSLAQEMSIQQPSIEAAKEFFGLVVSFVLMVFFLKKPPA